MSAEVWGYDLLMNSMEDPDRVDPTKSSGRPLMVSGAFLLIFAVLAVMVIIGVLVL